MPALDQAVEVGQISLDLGSQALVHWSYLDPLDSPG
jgi:hypothetical protein